MLVLVKKEEEEEKRHKKSPWRFAPGAGLSENARPFRATVGRVSVITLHYTGCLAPYGAFAPEEEC
jgi:hypothetical protein